MANNMNEKLTGHGRHTYHVKLCILFMRTISLHGIQISSHIVFILSHLLPFFFVIEEEK